MRLVSLTLENIKSYVKESISFYDGINFISGINGAGKTTVIEAIGCALFDSSPLSSQQMFIREGAKSGVITVVFEAADERLYRVVRRLRRPTGGSWIVIDEESGRELHELHGSQDVKAWLAANLGVAAGLEPSLLFEDVIAVPQGGFTAPFLERPERRKKIFNNILQLESYREAFEKTSGLVTALRDMVYAREAEIKGLQVRVEDLAACREQLKANREKAHLLEKNLQDLALELARLEKETEVQEGLKAEIEKREKELQAVRIRLDNLCRQKERLEIQVAEAAGSRQKAAAAEPGYREYLRLQEREKELDEKRKARESLKNEVQELQKQAAALRAWIENEKESRRRRLIQGETELKEIMAEGEKEKAAKQAIVTRRDQIAGWYKRFGELKEAWRFAGQAAELLEQVKVGLALRCESHEQLKQEKEKLLAVLAKKEETEQLAQTISALEEKLGRVRGKLSEAKARAATLEENRSAISGGLCPFLKKPCLNVEGSLEEYFGREIERIAAEIPELLKEEEEIEAGLSAARKAAGEIVVLMHQEQRLRDLERAEAQNRVSLEKEKEMLSAEIGPERAGVFAEVLASAEKALKAAGMGAAGEMKEDSARLAQLLERYGGLFAEFSRRRFEPLEGMRILEPLAQTSGQIKELADKIWERAETAFREALQETGSNLAACEARLSALRDRYRKVSEEIKRINEDRTVQEKEEMLASRESTAAELQAGLQQLDGLDAELEKNKERQRELEPFFIQYMQNIEAAARLESLKAEMKELEEETARRREEEKGLENIIENLRSSFKAGLLLNLKLERERLVAEKAKKTAELEHTLLEAEKNEQQVREKEGYQQQIVELERRMAAEKKALALLNLARNVLNQSGEKMARVYREYLGREADLIYQRIAGDNVHLAWEEDYEVKLKDAPGGLERERVFAQLSGGEKMTAALAVRLALLRQVAGLGIGFFDEPTANLDEKRRNNLARVIPGLAGDFRQLFLISHDDTFDAVTENIIVLQKESGGTKVIVSAEKNG